MDKSNGGGVIKGKGIIFLGIIISLIVTVIGITYAYWQVNKEQLNKNIVKSSCLDITLNEVNKGIDLPTAYPITDEEGSSLEPYKFTVKNNCKAYVYYEINLEEIETKLKEEYIKVKLNDKILGTLNELTSVDPIIEEAKKSRRLETGYLDYEEEREYELRIWMDEKVTVEDDAMNKAFKSKVSIQTTYEPEEVYAYVSKDGNDATGTGLRENPYQSIRKAYEKIKSGGNIILLSDIEEDEETNLNIPGKKVTIKSDKDQNYHLTRGNNLLENPILNINNNEVTLENIIIDGLNKEAKDTLIKVTNQSTINLENGVTIQNGNNKGVNDTNGDGGGIFVENSILNINGATIQNNKCSHLGGGIKGNKNVTLNMNSGTITNNTANQSGGGMHIDPSSAENKIQVNLNGGEISHNTATTTAGGGIRFTFRSDNDVFNVNKIEINNNTAATGGGGIYIGEPNDNGLIGGNFIINGTTINGNSTEENGGGIYAMNLKNFIIKDTTILKNETKKYAGGLYIKNSSLTIENGNIFENTANNHGGGIYITTTITHTYKINANITNNTATKSGGGLYIYNDKSDNNSTYNINGGTISNNVANSVGGGIRFYGLAGNPTLNIENVIINENSCKTDGGGIYFTGGTFNLTSGTINGNTANGNGGGVYVSFEQDKSSTKFYMTGGSIINNTTTKGAGGLYVSSSVSEYERTGGEISNNHPSDFGGIADKTN